MLALSPLLIGLLTGPVRAQEHAEPDHDLIYLVLVDRFANGEEDPEGTVNTDDPQAFHGGDLQGIIDRLDHLEAMGVRTLWITPIAESQTSPVGPWGAYHGYWITDHDAVEPRFGDFDTLARLGRELHQRDMRLVLDMVYNHVAYDSTLVTEHPDWFHPTGDIVDWSDPVERRTHRVHGLPDLDQAQPAVVEYLTETTVNWLERSQADGIRIDAIGHMESQFVADLRTRLGEAGIEPWILGEDFQGDPMALEETARTAQLDAIFDFPLYYALTDTLCEGQPMGRLASTLSLDRVQTSGVERVTFLDNHDLPRIASACGATPGRTRLALHLLFSLRGTPSLTYGTEAGLEGAEEPENRGDMPWDREMPLTEEIRQLWTFRNQGPNRTRDRVLFLDDETLFLLREGNDHSLLVLLHLGTEPRSLPWPEAFAGTEILASARLVDDEFTVSGPTSESPTSLTVGPDSLHRWIVPNTAPTSETIHEFAFEIFTEDERPLCEGSTIYVTGAGPELGNWDVSEALALEPMNPTAWTGSLEMAEGQVVAWHLLLNRDGEWIWADGPDRFGWVGDPEHDQGLVEGRILHLESTMLGIPSGDCPED